MIKARSIGLAAIILAALLAPVQALADWRRAESDHFVIYSDRSEAVLREYAVMLEDFDALLRYRHPGLEETVTPPKLDVYLIGDRGQLKRIWPTAPDWTGGFYTSSATGIFAVAMRDAAGLSDTTIGDDFVLHEYVHHFMMQYHKASYPAWLVEGYAEYYATVDLAPKKITIGNVSAMRASSITAPAWLGMDKLLSSRPSDLSDSDKDGFYAQSWLLTHYIMSDPGRRAKLNVYLREWRKTGDSVGAWKTAFGEDPQALRKSLDRYISKPLMGAIITRKGPPEIKMTITRLSDGADDVLLETLQLQRPVAKSREAGLLERTRSVLAKRPADRYARLAAARAETRFGDRDAGEAIFKSMIAADARDSDALRGLAESYMARGRADPAQREARFNAARPLLASAVQATPDDYRPYMLSAQMRMSDRGPPTENTLNVLIKAVQLAPQVRDLRMMAAVALDRTPGAEEEVRNMLEPLLGDPHGGALTTRAEAMIAKLDGKAPPPEPPAKEGEDEEG
jgi:hypothetical protein